MLKGMEAFLKNERLKEEKKGGRVMEIGWSVQAAITKCHRLGGL